MKAGGHDPYEYIARRKFVKTSKCRNCSRKLTWGDRTYEFDHKNNKEWDNSQKNCYLVCLFCHRKATVIEKRKVTERTTGIPMGYKTVKKKEGYKKERKRKKRKRRKSRPYNPFESIIRPTKIKPIRF